MTKPATSATEIQAAIDADRTRSDELNKAMPRLQARRAEALLADDAATVDQAEGEIVAARTQLARLAERIELLSAKLDEAREADAVTAAQMLRSRAIIVREIAMRLIAVDYPKAAHQLAEVIRNLAAAEAFIADANLQLGERAEGVDGPNAAIRTRASVEHTEIERYWIFPDGWRSETLRSPDGSRVPARPERQSTGRRDEAGNWVFIEPELKSREVIVRDREMRWLDPIEELVILPAAGIDDPEIWDANRLSEARDDFAKIVDELLGAASLAAKKEPRRALAA